MSRVILFSLMFILFLIPIFFQSCDSYHAQLGDEFSSSEVADLNNDGVVFTEKDLQTVNSGVALYNSNCATCHDTVQYSTKLGRTFEQIKGALGNQWEMNLATLKSLADSDIQKIAFALEIYKLYGQIPGVDISNYLTDHDVLKGLPTGTEQMGILCSRASDDKVRKVFCGSVPPPKIQSLTDLQQALGLGFNDPNGKPGDGNNPAFAVTAHSSSLVGLNTSSINPRAIVFTPPVIGVKEPNFIALGFLRGEQFVEIIANDPTKDEIKLFLVAFKQDCNSSPSGCGNVDLLTSKIESNWTGFTIYEDIDIKNTTVDCLHCHQPNGPGTKKIMRLQEFKIPWTHFMRNKGPTFAKTAADRSVAIESLPGYAGNPEEIPGLPGGLTLLEDFHKAHGYNEDYAGIPAKMFDESAPIKLEDLMRNQGFEPDQVNDFDGLFIETEVKASSPAQPSVNDVAGFSLTWNGIYNKYLQGLVIPPPYHDVKITDSVKLAFYSTAYQNYLSGNSSSLPDIRKVLKTDVLHEMGFAVKPGSSGKSIIAQACAQCHNSKLDQSISRARFDVNFMTLNQSEKEKIVYRLQLPTDHLNVMPPRRFKTLTKEQINTAVEYINSVPES